MSQQFSPFSRSTLNVQKFHAPCWCVLEKGAVRTHKESSSCNVASLKSERIRLSTFSTDVHPSSQGATLPDILFRALRSLFLFNDTVRCPSPGGMGNHVVLLRDRGFIDVGGSLCRFHVRARICFISQCRKREQAAKMCFEDNICLRSSCMSILDLLSSGVVLEMSPRSKERTKYACVCDTAWRVDVRRRDDLNCAGRLGTAFLVQAMKHATVRRKRATSDGTERLNSVRFPR